MVGALERIHNFVNSLLKFILATTGITYLYMEALAKTFIPSSAKSLKGEIVLITGSANGIGRQICLQLVNSGATLICWDIQEAKNLETVLELKNLGVNAIPYTVNISDSSEIEEAAKKVKSEVGDVTIIINNAGIMSCKGFLDQKNADIERTFQINMLAHFWIARAFLPKMIERNHGHICGIASACGIIPSENLVAYCTSKTAVVTFMEGLRQELRILDADSKIHLTTVYPSGVRTDMLQGLIYSDGAESLMPLLKPEYVASCIVNGIKRNYEHIYVPGTLVLVDLLLKWIPSKVLTAVMKLTDCGMKPEVHAQIKEDNVN